MTDARNMSHFIVELIYILLSFHWDCNEINNSILIHKQHIQLLGNSINDLSADCFHSQNKQIINIALLIYFHKETIPINNLGGGDYPRT